MKLGAAFLCINSYSTVTDLARLRG